MDAPKIGWIVYRQNPENLIDFVGIFPTQESAEKNAADMRDKLSGDWCVRSVPFQGWSHFPPGVAAEQPGATVTRP